MSFPFSGSSARAQGGSVVQPNPNYYPARAYVSSGMPSVAPATWTQIPLNSVSGNAQLAFDPGLAVNLTAHQYVAPLSGIYTVKASALFAMTTGYAQCAIYRNGTLLIASEQFPSSSGSSNPTLSQDIALTQGDTLQLWVYQTSGAAVVPSSAATDTWLSARFVAALPVTFAYTGSSQTYTVPPGVTQITFVVAGGGSPGVGGSKVQATLPVTPGETLQINVGGAALTANNVPFGGAGGGGNYGTSGAGASDVRQGGAGLANRVIVAGGAGGLGGGFSSAGGSGGQGGGFTQAQSGSNANGVTGGGGGTNTAGGAGGIGGANGGAGSLGQGGNPGQGPADNGGGGGGGYYGGGGGATTGGGGGGAGGGGGSDYVSPRATNVIDQPGGNTANANGYIQLSF